MNPSTTASPLSPTAYAAATAELFALQGRGVKLGLDNIRALLERSGSPQRRYHVIQVAGTNGKGSTASYLAAGLEAGGLRVGLFTSPHLVDFRERVRVDGVPISEHEVVRAWETIQPEIQLRNMTFFEANTAIALSHFAEQACDVVVLETGLGGRLDSTTAAEASVCVFTKIAVDHREYLGETLAEIAYEKAAILRTGVRAFSIPQNPETERVFRDRAREAGARLRFVERPAAVNVTATGTDFAWRGQRVRLRMVGLHQAENAVLALEALTEILPGQGLSLSPAALAEAVGAVDVPGRFHLVERSPGTLLLDVAHNPDALARFAEALNDAYPNRPARVFIAMLRDKDLAGSIRAVRRAAHLVEPLLIGSAASAPESRRLRQQDWLSLDPLVRGTGAWVGGVAEGLAVLAEWQVRVPGGVTALVGSFTTVGEALQEFGIDPLT